MAALDALDTGRRGGPEPEDITLEPSYPEADPWNTARSDAPASRLEALPRHDDVRRLGQPHDDSIR
jgi:hypothetical protein